MLFPLAQKQRSLCFISIEVMICYQQSDNNFYFQYKMVQLGCNTEVNYKSNSTFETSNYLSQETLQQEEQVLQIQLQSIKEMLSLLINYEKQCIMKFDLQSAKQTRSRIDDLTDKLNKAIRNLVQIKKGKQAMTISQKYEQIVENFDVCWNEFLNKTVVQLAKAQEKMKNEHAKKRQELIEKYEVQKKQFKASIQLNNIKRKILGLMKLREYEEAQFQNNKANKMQQMEMKLWQQKVEERKQQALTLLAKKQNKQFQVLRSKNQNLIFKKMKERDSKFDILLKKNTIKQGEIKKSGKQLTKNLSTASLNTKRII